MPLGFLGSILFNEFILGQSSLLPQYKSKHEGHLVAKFYFATQKLVWEFAGTLKSKIEITWDNIVELKANCPDNGPSSLTVLVIFVPLFSSLC